MHVLELPQAKRDILYSTAVPPILSKIMLHGRAKVVIATDAQGAHTFSNNYINVSIDLTERIYNGAPLRVSLSKPILPQGDGRNTRAADVEVIVINTDTHFAVLQNGAILEAAQISQAQIDIYATFGGQEIQLYAGRVVGLPKEEFGLTTFSLRDSLWEIVEIPVRFPVVGPLQNTYADATNGGLYVTTETVSGVHYYDAYTTFAGNAQEIPAIKVSAKDKIDLLNVRFTNSSPVSFLPTKYEIEFVSDTDFMFRPPDGMEQSGNRLSVFTSNEGIQIRPEDWLYFEDPDGTTIEILVYFTAWGNPITICKHLLEWGLLNSWGNALSESSSLPVNWAQFTLLESYYEPVRVYVSETNKDPSVYDYGTGRPLSVKRLCEMILEHVGCSLAYDEQGRVSVIQGNVSVNRLVFDLDSDMILSHYFEGGQEGFTEAKILFGYNDTSDSYAREIIFRKAEVTEFSSSVDHDPGDVVRYQGITYISTTGQAAGSFDPAAWARYQVNEYRLGLKYFKAAVSETWASEVGRRISERVFLSDRIISIEMLPQFGLPLQPGDKVQLILSEQPVRTFYAEVIEVSVSPGEVVAVRLVEIPAVDVIRAEAWDSGEWDAGSWAG